jgi:hypothetical protein
MNCTADNRASPNHLSCGEVIMSQNFQIRE